MTIEKTPSYGRIKETTTRDIQKTISEMYGINVDDSRVSKITDKPSLRH